MPSAPTTWEELRAAVIDHHGVFRIGMGVLREIGGYGRLGTNVRNILSGKLAGIGVGHLPAELPASQEQRILLYQYGTPAADVIACCSAMPTSNRRSGNSCPNAVSPVGPGIAAVMATMSRRLLP